MMRIIAISNQKGGSGKTTTAVNLGAWLALLERNVLIIDLDPQAHATLHLGLTPTEEEKTIYNILTTANNSEINEVIKKTSIENLFLLPSHINLSSAEVELVGEVGRESILKDNIERIKNKYHYILIDCPPSLGLLTVNALTAAREVFVPIQTEYFALDGVTKLMNTLTLIQKRLNHQLKITGVILTLFDKRKNLSKQVAEKVKDKFGDLVFKTAIRDNVKLAEAPSFQETITSFEPKSYVNEDYQNLAKEVIAQEEAI
ncbi:MAG: AAA family ATPase [Candidatus Omnitrophica bacterium]|nr:AAA family ATPase [Candidatus Omnitrophota bacterium]